ncbi:hypothetical protein KDAU_16840 [Dictyobacter aurantiacus]|uniref:Uncharacterized protein n=1 Tax=Dictyobacter aurantiacus TaxID=1936993 RepID=A0A401ZBW4_9CHLR|nr:hypothetical protein KDAU_16840 [Dictyobacter aurantiacus]
MSQARSAPATTSLNNKSGGLKDNKKSDGLKDVEMVKEWWAQRREKSRKKDSASRGAEVW